MLTFCSENRPSGAEEDAIVDYDIRGDIDEFPEIKIEFEDFWVLAHHEARPMYHNDMKEEKGLHIARSFKYNRTYDPGEFENIADQFEDLENIKNKLEKATSVDTVSYIDRVIN